jgi:lipopolysaccharide transport system ATP-binding protein
VFQAAVPPGGVTSVYATREQYEATDLPPNRPFVVVRDLRDTLVSAYFSFRSTHPQGNRPPSDIRTQLRELDKEDGMVFLMDAFLPRCAAIQESWKDEPLIHYEDLLENDFGILRRVLLGDCGLDVPPNELRRAVARNRFERITGRERGEEALEHLRKGISGDWRNHFTDRLSKEFEDRYPGR